MQDKVFLLLLLVSPETLILPSANIGKASICHALQVKLREREERELLHCVRSRGIRVDLISNGGNTPW
jgi:hypothetical protein